MASVIHFMNNMVGLETFLDLFFRRKPNHPDIEDVQEVEAETLFFRQLNPWSRLFR